MEHDGYRRGLTGGLAEENVGLGDRFAHNATPAGDLADVREGICDGAVDQMPDGLIMDGANGQFTIRHGSQSIADCRETRQRAGSHGRSVGWVGGWGLGDGQAVLDHADKSECVIEQFAEGHAGWAGLER